MISKIDKNGNSYGNSSLIVIDKDGKVKTVSAGGGGGITGGNQGQILVKNSSTNYDYNWKYYNQDLQLEIFSEGNKISDGFKGYRYIENDMILTSARIIANNISTISFTLIVNSISVGSISLVSGTSIIDTVLSGWSTNLTQGDYLEFYVDSPGGTSDASQAIIALTLTANKKL